MHIDNYNMLPDLLSLLTFWYCFTFTNGFWIVCIKQAQHEFSHRNCSRKGITNKKRKSQNLEI